MGINRGTGLSMSEAPGGVLNLDLTTQKEISYGVCCRELERAERRPVLEPLGHDQDHGRIPGHPADAPEQ